MKDFYFEQARESLVEDWVWDFTREQVETKLNVEQVRYRIYYSKDNLTRRIFIFRPYCTQTEMETLMGMGFVIASPGDTENIPDQPVEEGIENVD